MIEFGEGCGIFEDAHPGVTLARMRVVDEFGGAAIIKNKKKNRKLSMSDLQIVGHRKFLRSLAIELGAIERNGRSFQLSAESLVNKIIGMTDTSGAPIYPNIAEMDNEALKDLIGQVKANGSSNQAVETKPAKKAKAPSKEKKTFAKEKTKAKVPVKADTKATTAATKDTPAKAAPKKAAPKKAAPKKEAAGKKTPAKRKPTRRTAAPTTTATEGAPVDVESLKKISDMVEAIGTKVFDQDTAVSALTDKMTEVEEVLSSISDYLAWTYNQDVDPGNEITSLTEVSWE